MVAASLCVLTVQVVDYAIGEAHVGDLDRLMRIREEALRPVLALTPVPRDELVAFLETVRDPGD